MHLCALPVDEPSIACNSDLFTPTKQTWCIATTQTCFDGSVLIVITVRLVVEQFI